MDFHVTSSSEYGRFEQIVSQFLLKTLHAILDSRIPSLKPQLLSGDLFSNLKQPKYADKWFNLALGDRPPSLEKLQFWHRNLMDPMIIDIIIVRRDLQDDFYRGDVFDEAAVVETVVERWVVQYENYKTIPLHSPDISSVYKKMYQKCIILFRCLCSITRHLPAYRIFKQLCASTQPCDIDVIYKISSFSDPFSREEERQMKHYKFNPVEGVNGRLCVSVSYRSNLSEFSLDSSTAFPPVIIADYVGSPATDPMRAFSSMERVPRTSSFSLRGTRQSPSIPNQRPHSWSSGIHETLSQMQHHPSSGTPVVYHGSFSPNNDPSYQTSVQGQRFQNSKMPRGYYKNNGFEESLSPPFSPSSSPSGPGYHFSHSPSQSRLRPESAPMSIPHPMLNRSPNYLSPNLSDPSRHFLPPFSPRNARPEPASHGSPSPSGNRLSRKLDTSGGMANQYVGSKILRDSRDESGRFSGLHSSGSSPRKEFSGSSSRLSFQDDLDECDFSCPFDVDDVDTSDTQTSHSYDGKKGPEFNSALSLGRKSSQDAAVGALVHMLRNAPPLRQDSSIYSNHSQSTQHESNFGTTSGFFMPRRAADALEELKSYREMKDILLSKSGNHVFTQQDAQSRPLDIKGRKI